MGVMHTTNYATAIALLLIFAMHATADDVEAQTLTIQDSSLWNIEVIDAVSYTHLTLPTT